MKQISETAKRKRFFIMLPILVIPFLTFVAIASGVVTDQNEPVSSTPKPKGLNVLLPQSSQERAFKNKLSYYELAKNDSLKRLAQISDDPYYTQNRTFPIPGNPSSTGNLITAPGGYNSSSGPGGYVDPNEAKVYEKLNALNAAMNQPQSPSVNNTLPFAQSHTPVGLSSADVDRLEKMMAAMQTAGGNVPDPEMGQINGMLEKILDIQHPDRASEKLKNSNSNYKGQVYAVEKDMDKDVVDILSPRPKVKPAGSGFYSLEENKEEENFNAIPATIHETQTLTNGAIVKLRLLSDVVIAGVTIPKGNFAFGEAQISGERLNIKINTIRYKNSLFPVKLSVYDMDGLNGLYIPGAISREVLKESGTSALMGLGVPTIDGGIGAQAATAGIELTKTFLSKKTKLIQVTAKAGYLVLLKDENNQ